MSPVDKYYEISESWPAGATWFFNGLVTQVVGVPASIGITITVPVGGEAQVLSVRIFTGTLGAGRALALYHRAPSTYTLQQLMGGTFTTANSIFGPSIRAHDGTITSDTNGAIGVPYMPYLVSGGDQIHLTCASLANGETITLAIRMRIRGKAPTVAAFGAGVALTTTTEEVN